MIEKNEKLKNKNEKGANSYSLSQYTFKNSSYFKLLKIDA
jgi:hypothetical protein